MANILDGKYYISFFKEDIVGARKVVLVLVPDFRCIVNKLYTYISKHTWLILTSILHCPYVLIFGQTKG